MAAEGVGSVATDDAAEGTVEVVAVYGEDAGVVDEVVGADTLEGRRGALERFDEHRLLCGCERPCKEAPHRPVSKRHDVCNTEFLEAGDLPHWTQHNGLPRLLPYTSWRR